MTSSPHYRPRHARPINPDRAIRVDTLTALRRFGLLLLTVAAAVLTVSLLAYAAVH